jgi:hypothetical protein
MIIYDEASAVPDEIWNLKGKPAMTVYIVFEKEYYGAEEVIGVYDSEDKANEVVAEGAFLSRRAQEYEVK